jgi:hypothetical protein
VNHDVRKLVLLIVGGAAVLSLLIRFLPGLLGAAAGADVEIVTEIKNAETHGFAVDIPQAGTLRSARASFQRISVVPQQEHASVTATLDFDGTFNDTAVSSLGHERISFVLRDAQWVPEQSFAPRLAGIVRALELRRKSIEQGQPRGSCDGTDGGSADLDTWMRVKNRRLKATSWLIRSERDEVIVSEDFRFTGDTPDRPIDESGTRRMLLQPDPSGEFCFPTGLM